MKVQKVIFSCDLNPQYVGFWNSISKHTHEFLGLETGYVDMHSVRPYEPYAEQIEALLQIVRDHVR
jgi:hypothetical protein